MERASVAGHVVVAPDKFKGSLTAAGAAAAIRRGLHRIDEALTVVECPIADGGEGTSLDLSSMEIALVQTPNPPTP